MDSVNLRARGKRRWVRFDKPTGRESKARDSRDGTDHETGQLPPLPRGPAPIVPYQVAPAAAVAPPTIEDDLDAADGLEGALDLGEEEGAFGRHDRVPRADTKPVPRAPGTDAMGHLLVPWLPFRDRGAAPRAFGPHRRAPYHRCLRFAKPFLPHRSLHLAVQGLLCYPGSGLMIARTSAPPICHHPKEPRMPFRAAGAPPCRAGRPFPPATSVPPSHRQQRPTPGRA